MTEHHTAANYLEFDFAKGHGTHNDFVIFGDHAGELDISPEIVRAVCSRTGGIGADGLLRVVRSKDSGIEEGQSSKATWFMDYRNADGSLAEMCGNGIRVFAHWLHSQGLETQESFLVGTRAGDKKITVLTGGAETAVCDSYQANISVEMGPAEVTGVSTVRIGENSFAGLAVDVGNPHLVAVVPGWAKADIDDLELVQPEFDKEFFRNGVNVEIASPLNDNTTHMRVFERGVGETQSCGTGTVATARAALADAGQVRGQVTVAVPGGQVTVDIDDETTTLTGPSRIVARGRWTYLAQG